MKATKALVKSPELRNKDLELAYRFRVLDEQKKILASELNDEIDRVIF